MTPFSAEIPRLSTPQATTSGRVLPVFAADGSAFLFIPSGGDDIALHDEAGWEGVRVAPAGRAEILDGHGDPACLHLRLKSDRPFLLERSGRPMVLLFPEPSPSGPPDPQGGRLHHFQGGNFYNAGTIQLADGDVLWIEPGAWVRGQVVASHCANLFIGGGGVLDGSWEHPSRRPARPILLDHCRNVTVRDLLMIRPQSWMLSVGGCEQVEISGLRQISTAAGQDGIDIVGSRGVRVRDCFLRNGDDNIAVKALHVRALASGCQDSAGKFDGDWTGEVRDVLVEDCAFYNDCGGCAMEIGYETRTNRIADITFRNIDVMAVHQFGSVFGIHNGDRAHLENVRWEDVRVEHHYDKLIDFRILHSRWNRDAERGTVSNILLKKIRVQQSIYNTGYTVSLIGGYDAAHAVNGVRIEDFQIGETRVRSGDDMDLFTRHSNTIEFL